MESRESIPSSALATICEPPGYSTEEMVRQRVIRLAELIRRDGAPYPLTPALVNIWVDVFVRAQIAPERIDPAFDKAERELKYWPAPAEILGFITTAKDNGAEEEASLKFQWVRDYIRLHYHPDLSVTSGPPITERMRRAINAAGGMAYLSEVTKENLVFARKRFIETYLRWDELEQDACLLPDGEVAGLLSTVADKLSVERVLETPRVIEWRPAPKPAQPPNPVPVNPLESEPVRVVDVEGRCKELARQAELIKQKYPVAGSRARL